MWAVLERDRQLMSEQETLLYPEVIMMMMMMRRRRNCSVVFSSIECTVQIICVLHCLASSSVLPVSLHHMGSRSNPALSQPTDSACGHGRLKYPLTKSRLEWGAFCFNRT
jgi:hypothetical protein